MDIWQASETSHSNSSLGNFQHQYPHELLVSVYSYHLMVKSLCLAVVCMVGGFSQIQSQLLILQLQKLQFINIKVESK